MAIRSECAKYAPEHSPTPSGRPNKISQFTGRTARRRTLGQQLRSAACAGLAATVLIGSTGCTILTNAYKQLQQHDCLDEFMIAHRNRAFAAKAWYREQHCHKNHPHLAEFKAGFLQGYTDIANGGNGCMPCVAPDQYWGWRYQAPDGRSAIDAWFAGYPLGVKAAEQDGLGYWGHGHYGSHTASTTSKPIEPAPAAEPQPAETLTGPDGMPLMQESIVPGSARFVPDGQPVEAFELEKAIEMLETPEPAMSAPATTTIPAPASVPAPAAPAKPSLMPDSNDEAAIEMPANTLPANALPANAFEPQTTEPQTTPTTYSLGDLGDEAIEGIFGIPETPSQMSASRNAVETADAGDDIPFKFE